MTRRKISRLLTSPPLSWRPPSRGGKRRSFPWRSLPWVTVLLATVLLVLPLLGETGLAMYFTLRGERDEIRREVQVLQAEADSLAQAIDLLANDPAALERIAREEYNMRRPQEEVLLLVKPAPAAPAR